MSDLSGFTDEEVELLSSLPYRAGMFVSYADDADGEGDDEAEMLALRSCLKEVAKQYDGPGVVDDVFRATLAQESKWDHWAQSGAFNVEEAAKQAIAILLAKADKGQAKIYRAAVLEVASSVAQASSEFVDYDGFGDDKPGFFGALASKIVGGFSGLSHEDAGHPANVSASEEGALATLSSALQVDN